MCSRKKEGILPFLHEREEIHMRKFYTAEAVTEGHPDKLCDQIAYAILDVCLKNDENSRVACEVLATKGNIIVAGEITSAYETDVFGVVRKVLSEVGYSSEGIAMDTFVHQQSPDIAGAVGNPKEKREGVSDDQMDWFQGAGDQGVTIGYACDETKQLMPIPVVLANGLSGNCLLVDKALIFREFYPMEKPK